MGARWTQCHPVPGVVVAFWYGENEEYCPHEYPHQAKHQVGEEATNVHRVGIAKPVPSAAEPELIPGRSSGN